MANDPDTAELLSIDPTLLRLPEGYESTGDPVEENPFVAADPRHEMWAHATRIAEERITRVKADWLISMQAFKQNLPKTLEALAEMNAVYRGKYRELLGKEFDIWAGRGAQVVWTDTDVRQMDIWLVGYAGAPLDSTARLMARHGMPRRILEGELCWMRESLSAHVLHWKAENRRCRAIREEEARRNKEGSSQAVDAQPPQADRSPGNGPLPDARSQGFPERAQWLVHALEKRTWTVRDLERHGGPHAKTTRKILGGIPVRDTVLEKIAQALSTKGRVTVKDIPAH